jgi:hypothetical protein
MNKKKILQELGLDKIAHTGKIKKRSLFDRVQQLKKKKAKKNIIIKK